MYVGRIVAVGKNESGSNALLYRVSSRSYPDRKAVVGQDLVRIVSREGPPQDGNPYVTYNALRCAVGWAVAGNGTHTDPIIEKIADGMLARDAVVMSLLALDYERDQYATPRICAAVPAVGDVGWLGVVRRDGLLVKGLPLKPGCVYYTATYEMCEVCDSQACNEFDSPTPDEAARFIMDGGVFRDFERPVTSAAALASGDCFKLAAYVR